MFNDRDSNVSLGDYLSVYTDIYNKLNEALVMLKARFDEVRTGVVSKYTYKTSLRERVKEQIKLLAGYVKSTGIDRVIINYKILVDLIDDYFTQEDLLIAYLMEVNKELEIIYKKLMDVREKIEELEELERDGKLKVINIEELDDILRKVVADELKEVYNKIDDLNSRLEGIEQIERLRAV